MKLTLIPNWNQLFKFSSVWFMLLVGALQSVWPLLPQDIKDDLPKSLVHVVSVVLLIGGVLARAVKQKKLDETAAPPSA